MLRRRTVFLLAALLPFLAGPSRAAAAASLQFAPGQMWSLKDYPAKVIVGHVEPWYNTTVVLISIIDIPGGIIKEMSFMPVEEPALAKSVDKLLSRDAKPVQGFDAEYEGWKANPNAGIYSATVPKTIDLFLRSHGLGLSPSSVGR